MGDGDYFADEPATPSQQMQIGPMRSDHSTVLATPEATPVLHPMARLLPRWMQEEWADEQLPEACCPEQSTMEDEYRQLNADYLTCNMWAPSYYNDNFAMGGSGYHLSNGTALG